MQLVKLLLVSLGGFNIPCHKKMQFEKIGNTDDKNRLNEPCHNLFRQTLL